MTASFVREVADSPLARRNPSVKLLLMLVVSVAVMFVLDPVTPAVLLLVAFTAVVAGTGVRVTALARSLAPFLLFAVSVFVVNVLTRPGDVLWQAGMLRVTTEGVLVGLALAGRTMLTGLLAVAFLVSTDGVALVNSLHQHAGLSVRVTYAILAGYRMLQDLGAEWTTIRQAQLVRSPVGRSGRRRARPRLLAAAVFALLVGSIRRGERVAGTLELRGLGRSPRTVWRPVPLGRTDAVFFAVSLAVLAAILAGAAASGVLRGPGAVF